MVGHVEPAVDDVAQGGFSAPLAANRAHQDVEVMSHTRAAARSSSGPRRLASLARSMSCSRDVVEVGIAISVLVDELSGLGTKSLLRGPIRLLICVIDLIVLA